MYFGLNIEYGNPKTNKITYILYSNNFLADGYSCQTTKKEIANREVWLNKIIKY